MWRSGRGAARTTMVWPTLLGCLLMSAPLRADEVAATPAAAEPNSGSPTVATPVKVEKPSVRLHGSGSGRFEVVAETGADGVRLAEIANAAWTEWREPLGLPSRLPVAITVRLIPAAEWGFGDIPARVAAEAGGIITVWIREGGEPGVARERLWLAALAEGAMRRKAFFLGLDPSRAKAPTWLAQAAAQVALVAARPALLDAWQAEVGKPGQAVALRDVLFWELPDAASTTTPAARSSAAFGAWLWLREEGGKSGAWLRFVEAILRGEGPGVVLAREYGRLTSRPQEAKEWELAWRVELARLATARTTPLLSAGETRRRLEQLARITVWDRRLEAERVLAPWGEWAARDEAWLSGERMARTRLITTEFSRFHPFYRNAAGSLGRAWTALDAGREDAWREASVEWAQDMDAGRALEDASRHLLDKAEGR